MLEKDKVADQEAIWRENRVLAINDARLRHHVSHEDAAIAFAEAYEDPSPENEGDSIRAHALGIRL